MTKGNNLLLIIICLHPMAVRAARLPSSRHQLHLQRLLIGEIAATFAPESQKRVLARMLPQIAYRSAVRIENHTNLILRTPQKQTAVVAHAQLKIVERLRNGNEHCRLGIVSKRIAKLLCPLSRHAAWLVRRAN